MTVLMAMHSLLKQECLVIFLRVLLGLSVIAVTGLLLARVMIVGKGHDA